MSADRTVEHRKNQQLQQRSVLDETQTEGEEVENVAKRPTMKHQSK